MVLISYFNFNQVLNEMRNLGKILYQNPFISLQLFLLLHVHVTTSHVITNLKIKTKKKPLSIYQFNNVFVLYIVNIIIIMFKLFFTNVTVFEK